MSCHFKLCQLFFIIFCTDIFTTILLMNVKSLVMDSTAECPLNRTAFIAASVRMNCSGDARYLCTPNKDLSSLIEFCTKVKRKPWGPDNCVKHQSNGYLTHVYCKSTFRGGCPNELYFDDEIYKFPSCLKINTIQKCFLEDRNCIPVERNTTYHNLINVTNDDSNNRSLHSSEPNENPALLWMLGLLIIPLISIIVFIIWCRLWRVRQDVQRDSEECGALLQERDGERKLEYTLENAEEKRAWRTPFRKKLDDLPLNLLVIFYSLLFTRNKQFDLNTDNHWLEVMNRVRRVFGLKDTSDEEGKRNVNLLCDLFRSISNIDAILEVPDDLFYEIFWSFFRQNSFTEDRFDFFLKHSQKETVAEFCRTSGYQKVPNERCIILPHEYDKKFIDKLGQKILIHQTLQDHSIHEEISRKYDIPVEVLTWGKDFIQRYIGYLNNGKQPVYHTQGMIVGCAGAGKTTLLKRLKDCPRPEILNVERTEGVKVYPDVFRVENRRLLVNEYQEVDYFRIPQDSVLAYQFPINKERDQANFSSHQRNIDSGFKFTKTITKFKKKKQDNQSDTPVIKKESNPITTPASTQEIPIPELTPQENSRKWNREDGSHTLLSNEHTLKPLLKTFKNVIFGDSERCIQLLTLLDFAGQSAYYACHQIYLSARAFYILVVDMSKDLNDEVGKDVCDHSGAVFDSWKYRDFYEFWMKSIHTYSSPNAPVIIIATHAENKQKTDIDKFQEELFEALDHQLLSQHLVTYKEKKMFTLFLPMDETCELESVDDIKQCIVDTVEKQPYWGEKLPSSWVVVEKEISRRKKEKSKVIKIQKLEELCKNLSCHIELGMKQLKDALRFFHEIRTILYFDSTGLDETVILDVQWFVDAFKNIITDDQHKKQTRLKIDQLWEIFYEKGELHDHLLENIWKESEDFGESFFEYKKELLSYMQHLGLLSEGSEKTDNIHLIPCMNKKSVSEEFTRKCPQSYLVSFRFEFFPNFLFWRFIVSCVSSNGWVILEEHGFKYLFKNACILSFDNVDVAIKTNENIVDIQFLETRSFPEAAKFDILKKINNILQNLTQTFHTDIPFAMGCRCKETNISEPKDANFLSKEELYQMKKSQSNQCLLCETEKHQVPVIDLCKILEEDSVHRDYEKVERVFSPERRRLDTERDNQDMEFGVEDVKHIESLQRACSRGNKDQFDHEFKKIKAEKEILFAKDNEGNSLLHFACEGGNIDILRKLLDEGFQLHSVTYKGKTVLHIASQFGHVPICKYLLSKSHDLLAMIDRRGGHAVHFASEGGNIEVLKLLVNNNIDPKQLTKTGRNILHIASSNNQQDMSRYIVEKYPELLDSVDNQKWNALHFATAKGYLEMFDILVEFSQNLITKTKKGDTILHIACHKGRLNMCKRIIQSWPYLIQEENNMNRTPIFSAAEGGDLEIIKLLKNNGANEEAVADNHTLLHVASEFARHDICKYLLGKYPKMANQLTSKHWNALHMLAAGPSKFEDDEIDVFKLLVNYYVDIHQITKKGSSILKLACKNHKYELCKYMIENHRSLLDIPNVDLLKTAEENGNKDMIKLFKIYCKQD
ncbi:uncharacterized protein LOC134245034 [Saccostrea cucullata]|uniref:uncharacterized protein LOC134245034 n=1 Tax=Saccostrea cuccullata TaxID=36930 RepID=UPI002ED17174